jgi:hypothetical protein
MAKIGHAEAHNCPEADFRYGSFSTELGRPRDVRFPSDSDRTADIASGPVRANAQSRCAPARCAGSPTVSAVTGG